MPEVLVTCGGRVDIAHATESTGADFARLIASLTLWQQGDRRRAIAFVLDIERAAGRSRVDRRYQGHSAAEVESLPRIIASRPSEQASGAWFLPLEPSTGQSAARR
jgi:hypothetical protein